MCSSGLNSVDSAIPVIGLCDPRSLSEVPLARRPSGGVNISPQAFNADRVIR